LTTTLDVLLSSHLLGLDHPVGTAKQCDSEGDSRVPFRASKSAGRAQGGGREREEGAGHLPGTLTLFDVVECDHCDDGRRTTDDKRRVTWNVIPERARGIREEQRFEGRGNCRLKVVW